MSKPIKIIAISAVVVVFLAAAAFAGISLVSAQQATPTQQPSTAAPTVPTAPTMVAAKGLVVVAVVQDGAADKAGVKRGDVLLKVNDTESNTMADVQTALKDAKTGDPVVLSLTHGDEPRTLTATLTDQNGKPSLGLVAIGGVNGGVGRGKGMFFGQGGKMNLAAQPGATITTVTANTPAEQAGLKKGDRITAVNGKALAADYQLSDAIQANKPGDKVTLTVVSGSDTKDVAVTLGDNGGKAYLGIEYYQAPAASANGNGQQGQVPNLPNGPFRRGFGGGQQFQGMSGIVVTTVTAGSPAEKAGLKANDVITAVDGQTYNTSQAFSDAIAARKPGDTVTLSVTHSDKTTAEIKVTLGENPSSAGKAFLGVQIIGLGEMHQRNGAGTGGGQQPATPATPPAGSTNG